MRNALSAAAALAAVFLLAPASRAAAPASALRPSCGDGGYTYAGYVTPTAASGVAARLTTVAAPLVQYGHVAAWVGVGGAGLGPDGADEWVQAGIIALPYSRGELYMEYLTPAMRAPAIAQLGVVTRGASHDVAVREQPQQPGSWAVWVDGRRVGDPVVLPGSHGAWPAVATVETWRGGLWNCARFGYAFSGLAVTTGRADEWRRFPLSRPMQDPGLRVSTRASGFAASTPPW